MASIGHVAVGVAAARVYRNTPAAGGPPRSSILFWSALSMLPDADVIGFTFGINYAAPWGHRGATHSLPFALAVAAVAALAAPRFGFRASRTMVVASVVVASHGLLDTLTDGGLGCAFLALRARAAFRALASDSGVAHRPRVPVAVRPLRRDDGTRVLRAPGHVRIEIATQRLLLASALDRGCRAHPRAPVTRTPSRPETSRPAALSASICVLRSALSASSAALSHLRYLRHLRPSIWAICGYLPNAIRARSECSSCSVRITL
jgi:hypothetical protein